MTCDALLSQLHVCPYVRMEVCTLHIVCIITSPLLKLQVNSHKARVWTLVTIRINLVSPNVWFLLWKYHRLLYEVLLTGYVETIQWYVHHKRSYQWQLSLSSFLAMTTIVVITSISDNYRHHPYQWQLSLSPLPSAIVVTLQRPVTTAC